jgi:hypothetical protein
MSLQKLLSEYVSSVDEGAGLSPERTLAWAVIMRALWDAGSINSSVGKVYKRDPTKRKYCFKDGVEPRTLDNLRAEAQEWLVSESRQTLSLRWWLEMLDIDPDGCQPRLIKQIGTKSIRKALTVRGPYKPRKKT